MRFWNVSEGPGSRPSKSEQAFWLDLWVKSSFELAQWDNLQDYGKQAENFDILGQALAKTHNWASLRDEVLPGIKVSPNLPFGATPRAVPHQGSKVSAYYFF